MNTIKDKQNDFIDINNSNIKKEILEEYNKIKSIISNKTKNIILSQEHVNDPYLDLTNPEIYMNTSIDTVIGNKSNKPFSFLITQLLINDEKKKIKEFYKELTYREMNLNSFINFSKSFCYYDSDKDKMIISTDDNIQKDKFKSPIDSLEKFFFLYFSEKSPGSDNGYLFDLFYDSIDFDKRMFCSSIVNNKPNYLLIMGIVGIIVLIGGGSLFYLLRKKDNKSKLNKI